MTPARSRRFPKITLLAVLACVLVGCSTPKIGEEEARFWDLLVKVIGGVFAIGTVAMGFKTLQRQGDQLKIQQQQLEAQQRQFEATRRDQIQALQEEYHRRFWEKKLDFYVRLCQAAAALATAPKRSDDFSQKRQELTAMSVGELQVVASPEMNTALGNVLRAVGPYQAGKVRNRRCVRGTLQVGNSLPSGFRPRVPTRSETAGRI